MSQKRAVSTPTELIARSYTIEDAADALVHCLGWLKYTAERDAAEPDDFRNALTEYAKQRQQLDPEFEQFVVSQAEAIRGARLRPFHWTPSLKCPWLSWEPAVYALYSLIGELDPVLPDAGKLREALATFDQGFFSREIGWELDLFRQRLAAAPGKPVTVWHHGNHSYSLDGQSPITVSLEHHHVLQAFLNAGTALDTKALLKCVGNVTRVLTQLKKRFPGAVCLPRYRGDGYYIHVCRAPRR
jgi:hypothetical protein